MKGHILIVEDELELAELIQIYLSKDGIDASICSSGESALAVLSEHDIDLIVLDINLPGIDGYEFLQQIRPRTDVPVIIVSARDADEDIIMGLGSGADEFVNKPFSPRVLVARIRALLKRSRMDVRNDMTFGPYTIDLDGYLLKKDGERVGMSSKEFEVLGHLVKHPGRAMSPDEIYAEVWGNEYGDTTSVAVYIRRIRQKIEEDPRQPIFVQTIHGKGYRFNPDYVPGRDQA